MRQEIERCSGQCCQDFTLPFSPEEMRWKALKAESSKDPKWKREVQTIAGMLIFLRFDEQEPGVRKPLKQRLWHYTCKNFDPVTKNCAIYAERPDMCKNYPYYHGESENGSCKYRGCTRRCEPIPPPTEKKVDEQALDKIG